MIRRLATLAAALMVGLSLVGADRPAHADPKQLAATIAPEIIEVVTGGAWADGGKSGQYRAIVVLTQEGQAVAVHVFLQWLAYAEGGAKAQVVASVPIKEVRERKLDNAYVFFEGDQENQAQLAITSFDPKTEKESTLTVKAATPGKYSIGK